MPEHGKRLLSVVTVSALAASVLVVPNAAAAPRAEPKSPEASDAPSAAGKSDSDGDKITDDLEEALADLEPGDRVDVIVQGVKPGRASRRPRMMAFG